jgi:hypothetical protein
MIRVALACSGALFLGSTVAFFLLVPVLSIATVAWMLIGLLLMFGLGVQVGTRETSVSENDWEVDRSIRGAGLPSPDSQRENQRNDLESDLERVA